jgi:hypothetical protein
VCQLQDAWCLDAGWIRDTGSGVINWVCNYPYAANVSRKVGCKHVRRPPRAGPGLCAIIRAAIAIFIYREQNREKT